MVERTLAVYEAALGSSPALMPSKEQGSADKDKRSLVA
jgi:hypothetical protein